MSNVNSSDPNQNRVFRYDVVGNLIFHSQLGDIYYRDRDHVHAVTDTINGEHYDYDNVGQMLKSNALRISWNDNHRPREMENTATGNLSRFAYDCDGIRVKSEASSGVTLTPYPVIEVDPNGTIVPWIMAAGRRLARVEQTGTFYLHADALGSTRIVTDKSGHVVDEDDYGAWGEDHTILRQSANTYRFGGSRNEDQADLS